MKTSGRKYPHKTCYAPGCPMRSGYLEYVTAYEELLKVVTALKAVLGIAGRKIEADGSVVLVDGVERWRY